MLLLFSLMATAQNDAQISQQLLSKTNFNPAATGSSVYGNITAIARDQYVGFDGAPKTGLFNFDMPISDISSGIGLSVLYDEYGPIISYNAMVNYAYHIKISDNQHLSLGLGAGVQMRQYDPSSNVYENTGDPTESYEKETQITPDVNFGFEYGLSDWLLGASVTHLPQLFQDQSLLYSNTEYYAYSRYRFEVGRYWDLTPTLSAQYDGYSVHSEVNLMLHYLKFFWFGGSYRMSDLFVAESIVPMAGIHLGDNIRIGYAYDYNLTKLNTYAEGSHEIMLTLRFKTKGNTTKTPRFPEW